LSLTAPWRTVLSQLTAPRTARKPRLSPVEGFAARLGRYAPFGACISRLPGDSRPFQSHPRRPVKQRWVGLKGAAGWTKAGDGSTGANAVSEARSEPPESSPPGLSGC